MSEGDLQTVVQKPPPLPAGGSGFMFWILAGLAALVFAPCVLLPVWRDYQALRYAEQVERARLEQSRGELQRQQRRLEALQTDPAVIARVARRELRYRDPFEIAIPVSVQPDAPERPTPLVLDPVVPPAAVTRVVAQLPEADYDRLFCTGPTRTLLMCLSGGLLISAFVLYAPRRPA